MTLRGSVRARRTWVRILLLQILPDLRCTMTGIQSGGDQVTASSGNMHVPLPLLLEHVKPHEDRLYTVLHGRCGLFHGNMPAVGGSDDASMLSLETEACNFCISRARGSGCGS